MAAHYYDLDDGGATEMPQVRSAAPRRVDGRKRNDGYFSSLRGFRGQDYVAGPIFTPLSLDMR